jgi:CBS-domain-containing membrane protein
MARPRSVFGGHLIGVLSGLMALRVFGASTWVVVIASTVAFASMLALDCVHSPAGAIPALVVTSHAPWDAVP